MFRFTIRELLLLTLVVGMGVGWWVERNRLIEQLKVEQEFRARLVEIGDGYPDMAPRHRVWLEKLESPSPSASSSHPPRRIRH